MINQTTKEKIDALHQQYLKLAKGNEPLLKEIAIAEIPEMVKTEVFFFNKTEALICRKSLQKR